MNNEYMLELARKFSYNAHFGQFRFDGTTPYFVHPEAVANSFTEIIRKIVSYLHDILEDTDLTEDDFRKAGFSDSIIELCQILNKNNYINYPAYIHGVKQNNICKDIKKADIKHNSSDMPTKRMKQKYEMSLKYLNDEIDYDTFVKEYTALYK